MPGRVARRRLRAWGVATAVLLAAAGARAEDAPAGAPGVPQHALELEALQAPERVLVELPPRIRAARASGDSRELALLLLAQANACRVVADWPCQRVAGAGAAQAARAAGEPILRVRASNASAWPIPR